MALSREYLTSERGDVVGTILVFPGFFVVIFLIVHLSMWFMARHVTQTAAWEALRAAQLYCGEPAAAETADQRSCTDFAEAERIGRETLELTGAITDGRVTIEAEGGGDVRVEITSRVRTLPIFAETMSVAIVGPIEEQRIATEGRRG